MSFPRLRLRSVYRGLLARAALWRRCSPDRHLLQDDSLHHAAGQTCSANVNLLSSSIQRECLLQIHRPGIELLSHPQRSELGIAMTPRDEILERTTSSPVWYVGHMKADAFEIIDYVRRHPPRPMQRKNISWSNT